MWKNETSLVFFTHTDCFNKKSFRALELVGTQNCQVKVSEVFFSLCCGGKHYSYLITARGVLHERSHLAPPWADGTGRKASLWASKWNVLRRTVFTFHSVVKSKMFHVLVNMFVGFLNQQNKYIQVNTSSSDFIHMTENRQTVFSGSP